MTKRDGNFQKLGFKEWVPFSQQDQQINTLYIKNKIRIEKAA